jgi:hypothetical protein
MNLTSTGSTAVRGNQPMHGGYADNGCGGDRDCIVPPAEFVRLRYFFGQRLNVVDLADEQAYLVGKQRFHNLRAHGVGVLCGLLAERYVFPQGGAGKAQSTLIRVLRGAGLDPCGREIVVGWDQCIDVAAWFAQNPAATGEVTAGVLHLYIVLCYRECPSDPAPAPRDPCGCDAGGCEYARIREGFELKLLTPNEAAELEGKPNDRVPGRATRRDPQQPTPVTSPNAYEFECGPPPTNKCLFLAAFDATLDPTAKLVVDVSVPDNAIPERLTLLPTGVLQAGVLAATKALKSSELIGNGPTFAAVTFHDAGADSGTWSVAFDGMPLSTDPFATPPQLKVSVSQFADAGTWGVAPAFTPSYSGSGIDLKFASGLVDGGRYRVYIECDRTQPPVDAQMNPLTPPEWARHFRLVKDASGNLSLAASLY